MKEISMQAIIRIAVVAIAFLAVLTKSAIGQPQYQIQIVSLPGQATSNLQGISSNGQFAIGTSNNSAIAWTPSAGTVALNPIPGRNFQIPQSINNLGIGAGYGATTAFGSSPLPGTWNATTGAAATVPFVPGQTLGRVYGINDSGVMAGSAGGGSQERAATYTSGSGQFISQTFADGGVLTTAYGINNSGRVIGQGLNPANAAVLRAFYLDPGDANATDIGSLTALGHNSAIAFAISSNGRIAGSSSFNAGVNARPFVWDEVGGMVEVPLLVGTSQGSARGVNADGWAVGNMSSATSVLFLFDGANSYQLQDLLLNPTGWDLIGGTSNSALGIADNGTIVGRGLLNGQITGFVMTPVPEPATGSLLILVTVLLGCTRTRDERR